MSGGDLHVNEPQLLRNADAANQHAGHLRTWGTAYDNEANYKAWEASTGPMGAPVAAALREHGRAVHQNADQLAGHYDNHATASRTAAGAYHGTDTAGSTLVGAASRMGAGVGQMLPAVMAPLASAGQAVTAIPQALTGLITPATGMIGGAAGGIPAQTAGHGGVPLADPRDLGPHAHNLNSSAAGQRIAQAALSQLGVPYVWGGGDIHGPTKGGLDCSGLVQSSVYSATGIEMPRTSEEQVGVGIAVDPSAASDGDLAYFNHGGDWGHAAVIVGGGTQICEAPDFGQTVKISSFDPHAGNVAIRRVA